VGDVKSLTIGRVMLDPSTSAEVKRQIRGLQQTVEPLESAQYRRFLVFNDPHPGKLIRRGAVALLISGQQRQVESLGQVRRPLICHPRFADVLAVTRRSYQENLRHDIPPDLGRIEPLTSLIEFTGET
jgi:hypothetical protein